MKESHKVRAFTLAEVLAALLLSGILASLAGYALFFFAGFQTRSFRKQASLQQQMNLDHRLRMDFFLSDDLRFPSLDSLLLYPAGKRLISYRFADSLVIRTQLCTDTFFVRALPDHPAGGDPGSEFLLRFQEAGVSARYSLSFPLRFQYDPE
jgi:prepilin-type N-terminal cleavage/methylation domain-containing protein